MIQHKRIFIEIVFLFNKLKLHPILILLTQVDVRFSCLYSPLSFHKINISLANDIFSGALRTAQSSNDISAATERISPPKEETKPLPTSSMVNSNDNLIE